MRDQLLAWCCCLRMCFTHGRWTSRSMPHLMRNHPHTPITPTLHVCDGKWSWHEQLVSCGRCLNKSEMACVEASIATRPILKCRKSSQGLVPPLTLCSPEASDVNRTRSVAWRLAERVCRHLSWWTMIGEELCLSNVGVVTPPPLRRFFHFGGRILELWCFRQPYSSSQVLHQCLRLLSYLALPWLKLHHPSTWYALYQLAREKLTLSLQKRIIKVKCPWKIRDPGSSANFHLQCRLHNNTTQPEKLHRHVVCRPPWVRGNYGQR